MRAGQCFERFFEGEKIIKFSKKSDFGKKRVGFSVFSESKVGFLVSSESEIGKSDFKVGKKNTGVIQRSHFFKASH